MHKATEFILLIIILLAIVAVGLMFKFSEQEEKVDSNLEEDTTSNDGAVEEDSDVKTKTELEIFLNFDEDTDSLTKKNILKEYQLSIISYDEKNNSYLTLNKTTSSEDEQKELLEDIKNEESVVMAYKSKEEEEIIENEVDSSDNFDFALNNYEGIASVFSDTNSDVTFVYPGHWTIKEENKIESGDKNSYVTYEEVSVSTTEDKEERIEDFITSGFDLDGDVESEKRNDGYTILKWSETNGEIITLQALVFKGSNGYLFNSEGSVSFSDFSLIADSFTNKLKKD